MCKEKGGTPTESPAYLSHEAIAALLNQRPTAPAVTIYLPTHRAATPPNMTEDQIRCKNLVHKAVEILKNRDDGRRLADRLCNWLETALNDRDFWEGQTEGLLICARPNSLKLFHLPVDTEEYVAASDHFHLAPVFGILEDTIEYYVLAVAQHHPVLFRGDMNGVRPTGIALPETVEAGLNIDEMNQKSEQQRSAEGAGSGYNGRGGAKNPAEEERQRFWRMLDQIILNKADASLPLFLAGVQSDLAEYRAISRYPKLCQANITGNFSGQPEQVLFREAVQVARTALIEPVHQAAIEEYERAKGQAPRQAAHEISAIKDAAEQGRIDKLLLASVRYTTDTVRDNTEPVPVIALPPKGSSQAAHDIAYEAWHAGGRVINVEADNMPEPGALVLATLRY